MVESYIQMPVDGSGKKLRSSEITVSGNDVHEEIVQLANTSDVVINPATETTLSNILVALSTGISATILNLSIPVTQGTTPWVTSGSVTAVISNSFLPVTQSGTWSVTAQLIDSNGALTVDDNTLKQRMEYDSNNLIIYLGEASPSAAETANVWRIRKLTYVNNMTTQVDWADGVNTFTKQWSGRAGYIY